MNEQLHCNIKSNHGLLNFLGSTGAEFLHASGQLASYRMIELLKPCKGQNVLEIGFGTGATLILCASRYKEVNFFGYELSAIMYEKAMRRISFSGMAHRIKLKLLEQKNKFPVPDNSFDMVYAESILAIQEGDDLKTLLTEIRRVLKPKGLFFFNESIWLRTTERETARRINTECKGLFGVIQSNDEYAYSHEWKNLLTEMGFEYKAEIRLAGLNPISVNREITIPMKRSRIFTLISKIKARIVPSMIVQWNHYRKGIQTMQKNTSLVEGVIVKSINSDKC
jgi:ubiquinone/menaquinone biosynthesis C-methylase UbiE